MIDRLCPVVCAENQKRTETIEDVKKMQESQRSARINVRIPTSKEVLENPRRADFVGGGWIDSADTSTINLYWHKRQAHFTIYSLLQVLEHETLHAVLAHIINLETSAKLDNIHRSSCIHFSADKLIFVNEIHIDEWLFAPYVEEPTEDLLS